MKINWNFPGEGGAKQKPSLGEYGYFLELHNPSQGTQHEATRSITYVLLPPGWDASPSQVNPAGSN